MPKISAVRLKSETNCTVFIAKYIGRFVSDALSVLSVNGYPGAGVLSNTVRPHRSVAHAKVVVLYCTENNDGVVRAGYDRSQCGSRPHLTVRFGPDISNSVFEPYRTRENDIYNDWKSMHVRVHRFSLSPFSGAFGRWNRPQIRLGSLGLGNDWRELSPSGKQFNLSVNTTGYGQYVLVLFHVLFTPIQSPICRCVHGSRSATCTFSRDANGFCPDKLTCVHSRMANCSTRTGGTCRLWKYQKKVKTLTITIA